MRQVKIRAVYMRGGTSRAVVFRAEDLPADRTHWPELFLAAHGSPDVYGRQLDGMGTGVSSLSKICVVGPSSHPQADVDYTFAQVSVRAAAVDFQPNCGNMSSAIGPFAVDEGLVPAHGSSALVRIFNTNTRKIIHARFPLDDGMAAVDGPLAIPGVTGTGAPIRLDFLDPGGSVTGKLLPTGNAIDRVTVPGLGPIAMSIVDAANGCVFVRASEFGMSGTESPEALDAMPELIERLEVVRTEAALRMGLAGSAAEFKNKTTLIPMIGMVSRAQPFRTIAGEALPESAANLTVRMFSMAGWPHRAMPLTSSLCLATATRIEGTVAHECASGLTDPVADIRIAMPSGILVVGAKVHRDGARWKAESVTVYRHARRMFEGCVLLRPSLVPAHLAGTQQRGMVPA